MPCERSVFPNPNRIHLEHHTHRFFPARSSNLPLTRSAFSTAIRSSEWRDPKPANCRLGDGL